MRVLYSYVGPKAIAARTSPSASGFLIDTPRAVRHWIELTHQELDSSGGVTATFVVDEGGSLRIADRRSEHVACAGGGPVRSAGEIAFTFEASTVHVTWVTNQSTGYCPEADSWPAVEAALKQAGFEAPADFSQKFTFRRCAQCGLINIVKSNVFECAGCSAPLAATWNLAPATSAAGD